MISIADWISVFCIMPHREMERAREEGGGCTLMGCHPLSRNMQMDGFRVSHQQRLW